MSTDWAKSMPNYCKVYARRTPSIPFHNGMNTYGIRKLDGAVEIVRKPCLGCGKVAE